MLTVQKIKPNMATGLSGRVKAIQSDSEFQRELIAVGEKLIVADFFATWCAPCKVVAPKFAQLSEKHPAAVFLKVDVDICRNTAKRYEVTAMPTFVLFKNREMLQKVVGADMQAVESGILQRLASTQAGGETGGPSEAESVVSVPGQMSLNSLINKTGSECLNDNDSHPFNNALTAGKEFLESDCDEQLIIFLTFQMSVKLHTLQIVGPPDGRAPKRVKLFINQVHTLDFDSAEQRKAVQEFDLTEDDVKQDSLLSLVYVKFQNVQNLTIFIQDNQGGEETTVVNHLGIFGTPLDSTNMKDFKRVAGEKGERHA